jgi:membrane protein YqaA with SNARE-associated domain
MTLIAAYVALFGWAFAAATILPVDASFALGALVYSERVFWLPVAVATFGNVLGAWTTFWLGGRLGALRRHPTPREERCASFIGRFGAPTLLLSWVPVAGDFLVAVAGAAKVPLAAFLFWTTLGKAGRYLIVAWAALKATG